MAKEDKSIKMKFFYFIENWLIFLILLAFISYTLINFIFGEIYPSLYNQDYQYFIEKMLGESLYNLKSSLFSVAAIFIGIYFTVFTLLGSIKVDSIFAFLNEYTFKKLIKFIRNAFIASFSYLVIMMVLEISYTDYSEVDFPLVVLNVAIVIYMFLTAFRFGVILYISFSKDLNNLQRNIENHEEEQKKKEELQYRIENFLDEFEKNQQNEKNARMSEFIKNDKDN